MHASDRDPAAAQQLVARYAATLADHADAHAFPASVASLPASKDDIKQAVGVVVDALAQTRQLTGELQSFLEEAYVALANYVDEELAALAAEHRRASEGLEADPRAPRERLETQNWATVARASRLAGEIARASAEEASALRDEFRALLARAGGSPGELP